MPKIAPNSLKRLLHACKWISNSLRDCSCGFRVNSEGSEVGRSWAKSLGYSPRLVKMVDLAKCQKSLQTPWNASCMLANEFLTACGIVCVDFGSEIGRLWAKTWARFFKALLSESRINGTLSPDLLANKPHGFDSRPTTERVQAKSMSRKADFERQGLILRRRKARNFWPNPGLA